MLFDGKAFAGIVENRVKERVSRLASRPHIVSVLIGDDPASILYTRLKQHAAERVGITFEVTHLAFASATELQRQIDVLGQRSEVSGIMIQMPVPGLSRIEQELLLTAIPLTKDVDGLRWETSGVMPATVGAIMTILEETNVSLDGHYVVVGSHGSVGRPLVYYLRQKGVVEISEVNSDTPHPYDTIMQGDVVISCVGKPNLVTDVKPGAVAIDVGISKVEGKTVGDMTQDVYQKASLAVPVPGGVGPVTVVCLMSQAAEFSQS